MYSTTTITLAVFGLLLGALVVHLVGRRLGVFGRGSAGSGRGSGVEEAASRGGGVFEANAALQESEERLRSLSEATFEGVAISEGERILETNRAFAEIFGYGRREVIGMRVTDFLAPASREKVLGSDASGSGEPCEVLGLRRDGTRFDAEIRTKTSLYRDRPARVTAVRDITERRKTEAALRESEERYRTLVETLQEGVAYVGPEGGEIVYCNEAYAAILGLTPEELAGRSFFEFLEGEQKDKALHERSLRLRGIGSTYEISVVSAAGNKKDLSATGSPVFEADGSYGGAVHTIVDVTERKRAEKEIRKLNQSLERRVEERTAELRTSLKNYERAVGRERILRNSGAALAAAQDRERVYAAALEAVLPFIDEARGTRVSIWSGTGEEDLCVGAAGDRAAEIEGKVTYVRDFPDRVRGPLLDGRAVELRPGEVAEFQHAFGFETKLGAFFMIPLLVRGGFGGRVVVASDSALSGDIKYALEALGSQVALALERADLIKDLQRRTAQLEAVVARLRESEERYSLVVEGSNDGIYDWDTLEDRIFWNDRLFEMLGLSRSTFTPTIDAFFELVRPEDRERVSECLRAHLERGEAYDVEFEMRHASGEWRTYVTRGKAQRDESGRPFRMAGMVTDITERKRAEKETGASTRASR